MTTQTTARTIDSIQRELRDNLESALCEAGIMTDTVLVYFSSAFPDTCEINCIECSPHAVRAALEDVDFIVTSGLTSRRLHVATLWSI